MPKRQKDEEVAWASRKPDILNLWVEQDKPLSKVMQIMARQGFDRTKPQYERSFKIWRVSKNVFEEEWNFIFGRLDERRRPTNVKVRGVLIPQARLDRERRRRRETTYNICKSRLHPQSRPPTPPGVEVSTPPPAAEHDCQELSNESERGEDLDERVPTAESPQQAPVRAQEDDHVLSPTVTAVSVAAAHDVPDRIATETLLEATETPSLSSNSISGTTQRSCSELLYDYMRTAIYDIENEFPHHIPVSEIYDIRHLDKQLTRELLHRRYEPLLRMFVRYTTPNDDLYKVVRAFDTADDMVFLRRFLFFAKFAMNQKWLGFPENLLLYAAKDGNECLVVVLLDLAVYVNAEHVLMFPPHLNSLNALQFAVHSGCKSIVDILVRHGAHILNRGVFNNFNFLSHAITQRTVDLAKPMLAKVATWEVATQVLVHAVERSHDPVVNVLLEAGCNPYSNLYNPYDKLYRRSAFMVALQAVKIGYLEKFAKFPHNGLNKEQCKERLQQLTAGYFFSRCSENTDLTNAILDTGWHPDDVKLVLGYDYVQKYLYDELAEAARCSDCIKVDRLISMGASPNHPRDIKVTPSTVAPLTRAVGGASVTIARRLIAAGADVNCLDVPICAAPLSKAVDMEDLEMVRLLVEAGADVKGSAIVIAAESGNLEMVTYLLKSGADIQGRHNRYYRKALYYRAERVSKVDSARTIKLHDSVESPYSFSASPLPSTRMVRQDPIVELLQEWKRSHYGEQDCDTFENISNSITWEELYSS